TTTYTYDANDRLVTETTGGVETVVTYDANGNTLTRVGAGRTEAYTWDAKGRMTAVDVTDGAGTQRAEYDYDHAGLRVASRENGAETRFLLDTSHPFAQVVEGSAAGGAVLARYTL